MRGAVNKITAEEEDHSSLGRKGTATLAALFCCVRSSSPAFGVEMDDVDVGGCAIDRSNANTLDLASTTDHLLTAQQFGITKTTTAESEYLVVTELTYPQFAILLP
jgi:hypothetical protein